MRRAVRSPSRCSRGGIVELDEQFVIIALPAEDICPGGQGYSFNRDGRLHQKIVGVLALGGVAGGDEDDSGDDFPCELTMPEAVRISVSIRSFSTGARAGKAASNSEGVAERH